jgi:3-hydroxyisobutyrate dehydrogenase-like beta-hydroxyacid dehydrogenase
MKLIISATLIQEEASALTFYTERMLKVKQFKFKLEVKRLNKDGELSMSMKQRKNQPKVLTKTGASISTDPSTSDQDSQ